MSEDREERGERGKWEVSGGGGGGGRHEAKAPPPQVRSPGLVEEGGMASGGEGLLGESQEAPFRKDDSGVETEEGGEGWRRARKRRKSGGQTRYGEKNKEGDKEQRWMREGE